jgi:HPt (histidine-containing phosphotransfer) domain-containing protein
LQQIAAESREARPVLLDADHLARATLGDASLQREVLGLFLRQSDLLMLRLANAAHRSEWCEAAHVLKGSARGIGAFRLADIAEQAEELDWRARIVLRLKWIAKLEAELGAIRSVVEEHLAAL